MYSRHNDGKSGIAERFITILKNRIDKQITSISQNVYIDKLDDLINKYSNTHNSTIRIKPVDWKANTYINCNKEVND